MNEACAYAEGTPRGFIGKYRLVWRSEHFTVTDDKGKIAYFNTRDKAECAAWRVKHKIEQPTLLRYGELASMEPTEREKVFGADGTIYRNGKAVKVERKRAAA